MMSRNLKSIIGQSVAIGLLTVLALSAYGMAIAIHRDTLVNGAVVAAIAGVLAIVTGAALAHLFVSKNAKDVENWMKLAGFILTIGGVYLFAFYALNYYLADANSIHGEKMVVERRYYKIHHHSQRTGRRTYTQGAPYKVYMMDVELPDSKRKKTLRISTSLYKHVHKGDTLEVHLEKGLFGVPVIKDNVY